MTVGEGADDGPRNVEADGPPFEDFYERSYELQVRRAFLLTGSGSDAHDLVHECLTAMYPRWAGIRNHEAYLTRSVTNACKRFRLRRRRALVGVDGAGAAHDVFGEADLADLVLALPFRQRAVVVLRFYARMTEQEIADALGIRPGSVGPTLHRAKKRLRDALEADDV